jgi:hypothetical protein
MKNINGSTDAIAKHTPGPWRCEPYRVQGEKMFGVFCARTGMDGVFIGTAGSQPESEHNARLIAAAPDLLHALETVARVLRGEQVMDIMLSESGPILGDVVRDAIAKALGK